MSRPWQRLLILVLAASIHSAVFAAPPRKPRAVRMPPEYEPLSAVLLRWLPTEGVTVQTDRIGQGADEELTVRDYNSMVLELISAITETRITARVFVPDDETSEGVVGECLAGQQNDFCEAHDLNIDRRRVELVKADSDSIWIRDYGPLSIVTGPSRRLTYVDPNYYGGRALDDVVPLWAAFFDGLPPIERLGLDPLEEGGFDMEGGNLLLDRFGRRAFLTDHVIVENQVAAANSDLALTPREIRENVEQALRDELGIREVVILPSGESFPANLEAPCINDDALGCTFHVDMGMKIFPRRRVVISRYAENDPDCRIWLDDEYRDTCAAANATLDQWADFFAADGYSVFRVTNPPNGYDSSRNSSLVRTYANSLILNTVARRRVVVPTYAAGESLIPDGTGRTYNQAALDTYAAASGWDYEIVPINADVLVPARGSVHCIAMQVPKRRKAKGRPSGVQLRWATEQLHGVGLVARARTEVDIHDGRARHPGGLSEHRG